VPTLTLVVSLEAIFLSTFVMIGQNRQAAFQQAKADRTEAGCPTSPGADVSAASGDDEFRMVRIATCRTCPAAETPTQSSCSSIFRKSDK
jgi:hypothetical protein